jgi:hypothetical protein
VKVSIQIQPTAESLDQHRRAGLRGHATVSRFLDQVARDGPTHASTIRPIGSGRLVNFWINSLNYGASQHRRHGVYLIIPHLDMTDFDIFNAVSIIITLLLSTLCKLR